MPLTRIITGAIADGNVVTSDIADLNVTGPKIGINAISVNNFASGTITSNVLASNLTISVSRVSETLNINTAVVGNKSAGGTTNLNIDILNTTVYYFSSNTTGNVTFNLRGNNTTTFDSAVQVGNTVSVVIALRHNVAEGRASANLMIDGGYINTNRANPDIADGNIIFYAGNTTPSFAALSSIYPTSYLETNLYGVTIFKRATNSYLVLFSNTVFGLT